MQQPRPQSVSPRLYLQKVLSTGKFKIHYNIFAQHQISYLYAAIPCPIGQLIILSSEYLVRYYEYISQQKSLPFFIIRISGGLIEQINTRFSEVT